MKNTGEQDHSLQNETARAEKRNPGPLDEKEKIRARYAGTDGVTLIPARLQPGLLDDVQEKRVAVYARVSTGDPRQASSYELQKNHYQDVVNRHPGWKLAGIYADEGISGTSLQHRDAFVRMIDDCREHKIDLILTKSVSRFARNVLDCIGYVRELAALDPPIGILFEAENIYTLDRSSEMSLSFVSTLAQEESHNKSEVMNASIEMRFRRGIFLTPPLLGYDRDESGTLVVNEEEAKTVRLIFYMYLYGYTCTQIADALTQLARSTKNGSTVWSAGSVLGVLQNERHCGDILARKTWTPSYLNHRARKNRQNRNQYYQGKHHAAIISRDDFIAVQRLIRNAKYGNRGFLPELEVISQGALTGFVLVHPRWAGFQVRDYLMASASVESTDQKKDPNEIEVSVQAGDFDYRGYEVARGQFFDVAQKLCVTFSSEELSFSTSCVRKLPDSMYVELLLHPYRRLLAVRPSAKGNRRAIQWAKPTDGRPYSRSASGRAFLPNLFTMFGWDKTCKYRVQGIRHTIGTDSILLFNLEDTEVFIPKDQLSGGNDGAKSLVPDSGTKAAAYPADWVQGFGANYYCHREMRTLSAFGLQDNWEFQEDISAFQRETSIRATSPGTLQTEIAKLIQEMKQENSNE